MAYSEGEKQPICHISGTGKHVWKNWEIFDEPVADVSRFGARKGKIKFVLQRRICLLCNFYEVNSQELSLIPEIAN